MFMFTRAPWQENETMKLAGDDYVFFNYRTGSPTENPLCAFPLDGPETGLVIGDKFFILNGDFRQEYQKAANNNPNNCIEACLNVFKQNIEYQSSWSDLLES